MNKQIAILINQYQQLNLSQTIDYDKFNQYAIVHHSATIEGSTLTEVETRLLIEEGITPKGKPLLHSLMVQDHYNALLFILKCITQKQVIDSAFIRTINSHVMKKTGSIYQTVFGELDASQGVFRKGNVSAGNSYFVGYDKVEMLVEKLCLTLREKLLASTTIEEQLLLSFDAHFDLVSIHPFYDGNGRTSRLLMNFIQSVFQLPMAIVFKEDKVDYFEALTASRKAEDLSFFREFMYSQYSKLLSTEIDKFNAINTPPPKKGSGYSFIF